MRETDRLCRICKKVKSIDDFPPNRPDKSRHYRCRDCQAIAYKQRYHADTKRRVKQIAYSFNGSAVRRNAQFTPIPVDLLLELLMNTETCRYCALPNDDFGKGFHLDHVIPVSKGGTHQLENIALCCEWCNRAKWDSDEKEFNDWLIGVAKRLAN